MKQKRKHIVKSILSIMLVLVMALGTVPLTVYATDTSFSATFKYEGKTYVCEEISDGYAIQLSDILSNLEITGTVTAASVSEDQGMTVTTSALTMTKAFGTGWLRVTAGGTEYEITITSTPDSISVVLYGTLFFDKNGGSGIMDGQSVREYSTTVLPDCTFTPPDGYEFDQWEINGARYNAGATYTFGQTTTAKAIWKLREGVHSITAVYNNSDGDVVVSPTMAAAGETVTVTVQPVAGKAVDSISYSYGSTTEQALSGGDGGVYTFSMPGEDTTVSVTFKEATKEPIAYVDENESSQSCNDYRYVRSTDTIWSGWVVASQNLTLNRRVTVSGTVNLILMDGKTLTVTGGIQVGEGSTLNIYAQSGNTGALIAGNKQNTYAAGIGGNKGSYNAGTITVNGGQITATGGLSSAGIGGSSEHYPYLGNAGTIKICGNANVDATGGEYGSGIGCGSGGIGGSITIDGNATVQAKALEGYSGSGAAIGSGRGGYVNSITISGGTVIATGANMGSAIGNGNSNSGGDGGTISITGGDVTATATGSWGAGIGGLCKSITIGGNAVVHATGGNRGAGIGGYYQKAVGNITIEGNANVTATGGASGAGIGTGSEAEGEAVITITGGTVNASMSASNGAAAIGSGNKSKGKTTVSISGGQVTASGSSVYGVGIGGGNTGAAEEEVVVNITGGAVDSNGRAGIGTANASNAKLTINISGGKVTARGAIDGSNKCAAIGQGNNSNSVTEINITGGIVRALGTGTGIGSGANSKQTPTIKLGYTDETKNNMEITAIDYNGTVTLNDSFKYQDGTGAVSTPITANKTIVPSVSTAHTHTFTYSVSGRTITATCANSDNSCDLTDAKATLTIGEPDGKTSMVYDGTAKAAILTGNSDVLAVDVVYKKGNTVLPSAPSDAGNYTASITLGEATATVSYEITKKSVTFASITAKDKVYDGTTKASCTIGTGLNGAVSGDNVYADVNTGNAAFEDANAGVNKKVTFSGREIAGKAKGNYELIQPEPQYRAITPRVITITAKAQTVPQGGTVTSTPEQVEVTGGTLADGQRISEITLTGDTSAETTSGTVTPSAVKILDASDNDVTANYAVNYAAGTLTVTEASPHTHEFTYSATGNNITATCNADGCTLDDGTEQHKHAVTLTIVKPTLTTYGQTGEGISASATLTGLTYFNTATGLNVQASSIIYWNAKIQEGVYKTDGDQPLTAAPTSAGNYLAKITVNNYIAAVGYTINKADPTAPTGLTATYGQTLADVTLPDGWTWKDSTQSVGDVVSPAATFKANFAENDNYNAASDVDVTVTVSKASNPATVTSSASVTKGNKTVDLANNVTLNGATGDVGYTIDGEAIGCTLNGSVLTSGNTTGTVTVNVTVAADSNFEALAATPITVTINDKPAQTITASDVTATYGDTDKSVSAIVTDPATGGGAISYAVKEGSADYIDVDPSTGELTIKSVPPTDGKAYVIVKAAGTDDYAETTKEVTFTISKANAEAATVTANNRTFDSTEKPLVTVDNSTLAGGTMWYALGENATTAPADNLYTTSIPAKTDAGTYYVWYKVKGDTNYNDTKAESVKVSIAKATPTYTKPDDKEITCNQTLKNIELGVGFSFVNPNQELDFGENTVNVKYTPTDTANYNILDNISIKVTMCHAFEKEAVAEQYLKSVADCTHKAVYYKSCECGKKGTETFEYGETLDHNYGKPTYTWSDDYKTCTAVKTCSRCNDSITETVNATSITTQATCEGEGKTTYTATFTKNGFEKQTKEVIIDPTGHDYEELTYTWSEDGKKCSATAVCANDATHVITENATVTSKVTTPSTCKDMGKTTYTAAFTNKNFTTQTKEVTDVAKLTTHTPKAAVKEKEVVATCEKAGSYEEVVYCSVCNKELSRETKTVDKLGHKMGDWVVTTPATETTKGVETRTCTRKDCNYSETRDIPMPSHEHTYEKVEAKDASCSKEGNIEYWTCKGCGKLFADKDGKNEINVEDTVIEKAAHTPGKAVKEKEVAATCEEDGSYDEVVYCSVCKAEISRKKVTVHALGHSFGEWVKTKDPSETEPGLYTRTCKNDPSHTETKEIPVTTHKHKIVPVTEVPATCTNDGVKAHYICSECDLLFEDADGTKEILDESTLVIKGGHKGGKATCSHKAVCEVCHEEYGELDPDNHEGETEVRGKVDATCTADGFSGDVYCKACNKLIENGNVVKATGHDYGTPEYKWSDDGKTCTATVICKRDGCTESSEGYKVTENAVVTSKVKEAATTEKMGITTYTATFKNELFTTQTKDVADIPKLDKPSDKPADKPSDNPGDDPSGNPGDKPADKPQDTTKDNQTTQTETPTTPVVKEEGTTLSVAETKAEVVVTSKAGEEPTVTYKGTTDTAAKEVTVPDSVTVDGVTYKVTLIAKEAFKGNKTLEKATVGENIETVGDKAFAGCTNLKTIVIKESVKEIGNSAFEGCSKLSTITLGSNVETVGNKAFANCKSLTKIIIPKSTKKIGNYAFKGNKKLKTIIVKTTKLTKKTVAKRAFSGVGNKVTIKVPKSKKKVYKKLFRKRGLSKKVKVI